MKLYSRFTKYFSIVAIGLFVIGAVFHLSGLRFNTTKSVPLGFYWISNKPVTVGSYVMFCPPPKEPFIEAKKRGYLTVGVCEGNFSYMMKKVLAAKNDNVLVNASGVYVNSRLLGLSKPFDFDGVGRAMPRYPETKYTLQDGELLLMSDVSSTSFDARYFGPVHQSQINTVITPIFTW